MNNARIVPITSIWFAKNVSRLELLPAAAVGCAKSCGVNPWKQKRFGQQDDHETIIPNEITTIERTWEKQCSILACSYLISGQYH
jgi:hypothetical protein